MGNESANSIQENPIERTLFQKIYDSSVVGLSRVVFTFGLGHPFDLVKTRMQSNPHIHSGVLLSKEIYQKTGIRGFYTAGVPNFARAVIKDTYRHPLRGAIKSNLNQYVPASAQKADIVNTTTGLLMAATDTVVVCPLERIKVMMMTAYEKERNLSRFFKQVPDASALGAELFKGLRASFARSAMTWSSYLVAEERIYQIVKANSPRVKKEDLDLPFAEALLVGGLGGLINGLCTMPFDSAKTQMQKMDPIMTKKITEAISEIYSKHGLSGVYAGWQIKLVHYAVVGAITSRVLREVDAIWTPSPSPKP